MKRLALWALLAASLSANVAIAAVAVKQRSSGPPGEPLLFSKVALDPVQRTRISELRAQLIVRREQHGRAIAELRAHLARTIVRQPDDRTGIDSTLRSIAESQASFQRAVVDHVLAVRAILRPEQQQAFQEMVAEHMQAGSSMSCGFDVTPGDIHHR